MSRMPIPLTLVVAATANKNGIGRDGKLPWRLSNEIKYFAHVTTRVVHPSHSPSVAAPPGIQNAVIMGRKTWESIPAKYRPLKNRTNIIITRNNVEALEDAVRAGFEAEAWKPTTAVIVASSLADALAKLEHLGYFSIAEGSKAFVIGGASIYNEALQMEQCKNVLLTRVMKNFRCDTFFPVDLQAEANDWQRKSQDELEKFTGEEFGESGTKVREGDVEYEYCLYQR